MTTLLFIHPQQYVCDKILYVLAHDFQVETASDATAFNYEQLLLFTHILVDKSIDFPFDIPYVTCSFSKKEKDTLSYSEPVSSWKKRLETRVEKNSRLVQSPLIIPSSQIITFLGVRGNVGTTSIAWACAEYLKTFGQVCYLSFSPLQDIVDSTVTNHTTFSTVLMALKTNQSINLKDYFIYWQGVMTFAPSTDRLDYTAVECADIRQLVQLIREQSNCQYIIIDTVLNDVLYKKELIEDSHKVFVVDSKEQLSLVQSLITNFKNSKQLQLDKLYYILNQKESSIQQYDIILPTCDLNCLQQQYLQSIWQVYL